MDSWTGIDGRAWNMHSPAWNDTRSCRRKPVDHSGGNAGIRQKHFHFPERAIGKIQAEKSLASMPEDSSYQRRAYLVMHCHYFFEHELLILDVVFHEAGQILDDIIIEDALPWKDVGRGTRGTRGKAELNKATIQAQVADAGRVSVGHGKKFLHSVRICAAGANMRVCAEVFAQATLCSLDEECPDALRDVLNCLGGDIWTKRGKHPGIVAGEVCIQSVRTARKTWANGTPERLHVTQNSLDSP